MTYQTATGCLSPGAHAGSYNGQDAYNDMLVVDDGIFHTKDRHLQAVGTGAHDVCAGLQRRNRPDSRGGVEL